LRKGSRAAEVPFRARLTSLVARDVRREIEIVEVSELAPGQERARIRVSSLLSESTDTAAVPAFEAPRRVAITDLWTGTGQRRGGQSATTISAERTRKDGHERGGDRRFGLSATTLIIGRQEVARVLPCFLLDR
jgi:hypothetical protein